MPATAAIDPLLLPPGDPLLYGAAAPASAPAVYDPPPFHGMAPPPHSRDCSHWPADMPPVGAVHEAAHAVVGRALGLRLVETALDPDGSGFTVFEYRRDDPGQLAALVVATAAAPVFHERARLSVANCSHDFERVAELLGEYRRATGRTLACWSLARGLLREPRVGADVLALAGALSPGCRLTGDDVDRLLGPAAGSRPDAPKEQAEYLDHGRHI